MNNIATKIKLAEEVDQDRWDEFIINHPEASPYHLFAWKKAIEDIYGHKCIYFYAEKGKEIIGVLPLVHLHFPIVINELVSLPYCDVGNCIAINEDAHDLLIKEIVSYFERCHAKNLQIRGNLLSTEIVESKFQIIDTKKVRMRLELPSSSEKLSKSFKSKLRSQVRKAKKNGIKFYWGGVEKLDAAYGVFSKNMHELGSPVHSRYFLKAVLKHYGERSKLGLAEYKGKIIGMGIILIGGRGVSIPWASTDRDYNRLGPNMLLYWNFLKYSADNGYEYFDFGRSYEGEGTYRFKKQWGAKPEALIWYESAEYTNFKEKSTQPNAKGKREFAASMWQKLPIGMANYIGPHIRKYISL